MANKQNKERETRKVKISPQTIIKIYTEHFTHIFLQKISNTRYFGTLDLSIHIYILDTSPEFMRKSPGILFSTSPFWVNYILYLMTSRIVERINPVIVFCTINHTNSSSCSSKCSSICNSILYINHTNSSRRSSECSSRCVCKKSVQILLSPFFSPQ